MKSLPISPSSNQGVDTQAHPCDWVWTPGSSLLLVEVGNNIIIARDSSGTFDLRNYCTTTQYADEPSNVFARMLNGIPVLYAVLLTREKAGRGKLVALQRSVYICINVLSLWTFSKTPRVTCLIL
jgi:hypothetical protein